MAGATMNTRHERTAVNLPDIFRTSGGINFNIGPSDRLRDAENGITKENWNVDNSQNESFPRIILKDQLGRELDTFTTLQEAIYRAKWNVKRTGQSRNPLEWRLPKAPVPARPDYTTAFPPLKHPQPRQEHNKKPLRSLHGHLMEFDVEDVGFIRESLKNLPYVPSLSFLRQEFLVGPKTYFQIVGTMLLHKKILSHTEKRQAIYSFPGFCSGCQRSGLCYGCERSSQPHYHADKVVKTGGGFTYFKKDRPSKEISSKNPSNWKIHDPSRTLKRLMEDYIGVNLESQISAEVKKHLDQYGGPRTSLGSQQPDDAQGLENYENQQDDNRQNEDDEQTNILIQIEGAQEGEEGEGEDNGHGDHDEAGDLDLVARQQEEGEEDSGQGEDDDLETTEEPTLDDDMETVEGSGTEQNQLTVPGTGFTLLEPDFKTQHSFSVTPEPGREDSDEGIEHRLPKYIRPDSDDEEYSNNEDEELRELNDRGRDKKRGSLYRAPKPFKPKVRHRKISGTSPFTTNRKYSIPQGRQFMIKKSDKGPTEFKEFKRSDDSWEAPKQFELQKTESKTTKFWSGPAPKPKPKKVPRATRSLSPPRRKTRQLSPLIQSPDSGVESGKTDSSVKSPPKPKKVKPPSPKPVKMEEALTPIPPTPIQEKPKREIVKKEKPVEPPRRPKPRTPSPPPKSPSPIEERPPQRERELSFVFVRDRQDSVPFLPQLPPIEVPALPDIKSPEPETKEQKQKSRGKLIEVTPDLKEAPKKLRAPPKIAPRIKPYHMRRAKVAEAPVTTEELQELSDPLDFLAKYCIINPERLPYYERVFNGALSVQTPRYGRELELPPHGARVRLPPAQLSSHELQMLRDLTVLSRVETVKKQGLTTPEQYLEKLNYSIEFIQKKQDTIADKMAKLQAEKTRYMAELAKQMKPEIARLSYKSKSKTKKRDEGKSKKKKHKIPDYDAYGAMAAPPKNFEPRSMDDITDEVIVSRMDEKMMKKVKKDPRVHKLNLELKREIDRLKHFDERLNQIDDEKDIVNLYCMDYFYSEQMAAMKAPEFKRQQSQLWIDLHPEPDTEMNIEEVEAALQQINNRLITEKEFQYIFFILNLPRREKINFRLFCIIAALSEKVSQMDPFVRKLMNKVDYNALDVKMEKSKELFGLLQDGDALPPANALASNLSVELTAGGLTPEHTDFVLSKFNREGSGFVDFLDFVTYVPLFIEIHKRIIQDPFNDSLDI